MTQATAIVTATPSLGNAQRIRLIFCLLCACVVAYVLTAFAGAILQDPDNRNNFV